ncbi:hypothetical protein D3C87_1638290 [compost metagenome]
MRKRFGVFGEATFFTGKSDVEWLRLDGHPMVVTDWEHPATDNLMMVLATRDGKKKRPTRLAVVVNRSHAPHPIHLPESLDGQWQDALSRELPPTFVPPRSVSFFVENF